MMNSGDNSTNEVELNITPIIDAFVVLITFLLISASFLSIGIFDAGLSAAGKSAKAVEPPPISIKIDLQPNQGMVVNVSGKVKQTQSISAVNGEWNYAELTVQLAALKQKWPEVSAITLSAENGVRYKDVVKAMEITRKQHPNVLLGGF